MNTREYEALLANIRAARIVLQRQLSQATVAENKLAALLRQLDQEDSRIARQALTSMHSASRKLVVSE